APWLVTRLPTRIRRIVQPTKNFENRWSTPRPLVAMRAGGCGSLPGRTSEPLAALVRQPRESNQLPSTVGPLEMDRHARGPRRALRVRRRDSHLDEIRGGAV